MTGFVGLRAPIGLVGFTCLLAACGFEPIHRLDNNAPVAYLAQLETPPSTAGQTLRRALLQGFKLDPSGVFDVTAELDETSEDSQLDEQGVAQRLRLSFDLRLSLRHTKTGVQKSVELSQTLFVSRGTSGAEDRMRRRVQTELAMRQLADRAAGFIRREAAAQNKAGVQ